LRRNSYDNLYVTVILILLDVSIFGSPDPMCTNIKPPHLLARRQKTGVSFFPRAPRFFWKKVKIPQLSAKRHSVFYRGS
jgi:hypothetical protein